MEVKENERIFSCALEEDCKWKKFYDVAKRIEKKLNVKYNLKAEDFDCLYYDFNYLDTEFVLHYHSMVGDVEVFTNKENCRDKLVMMLNDLNK